ncbi:MAG: hypothetical protein ACK54F_03545 [Planctomycetia bacterium]|jgi:hypothetical protein
MSTLIIGEYGNKWYYNKQGQLHRTDGPAIEWVDGNKSWYVNGQLHRPDGPAVEWDDGDKEWWVNGKLHRTDGPAYEWADGSKAWYVNGQRHRPDGPAIEWAHGSKEWWVNGQQLTEAEFNARYGQQPSLDGATIIINGETYKLTKQ